MRNRYCYKIIAIVVTFYSLAWAGSDVAVLVEPGLANFGGQLSLMAQKVKPMLEARGIECIEITAEQMADEKYFNTLNFSVVVMVYGNAFPLDAYENLRNFHSKGGSLVVNGIPFCHPNKLQGSKWIDEADTKYLVHDQTGMGTGSFKDPVSTTHQQRLAVQNPLQLSADVLPRTNEWLQYLDTESFPTEDIIIPIVETRTGPNGWAPVAAIIEHKCELFEGALTLWLGQVGKQLQADDNYYLQQAICRGIAYILKEKGKLTHDDYKKMIHKMNSESKPVSLPENLKAQFLPRPWGDTFLPKSKLPAKHILAVNMDPLRRDQRIALATLQGLTSRKLPEIWLNLAEDNGPFWLDWHKEKGYIESYENVKEWKSLFSKFSDSYKGAVISDDQIYRGELIAINVASCEDLIVASPEVAKELGLKIKMDLRGKFKTHAQAMQWLWAKYRDQFNLHICDAIHPSWLHTGAFAYDVQWKSIVFWVSATNDGFLPGADPLAEMAIMADIFAQMPVNTAFLGFPWCGDGVGLGEVGGTSFCGGYGKSLTCTDNLSNLPVTSGVTIGILKQKKQPPAPNLEKDKIYIAVAYSDGDNQNIWQALMKDYFLEDDYGKFPVSFGMGPVIHDLQPALAEWFYEHAAPTTEFISDVSGVGYMRPEDYGLRYSNREEVLAGFMEWTAKYLHKMDYENSEDCRWW